MTGRFVNRLTVQLACLGPVGKLPIAPGTWGSGFAVLIWWFFMAGLNSAVFWIIVLCLTAVAIPISGLAEKTLGRDARPIVIDELVGQLIALSFCHQLMLNGILSFFLFRLFDIWKPFPINSSQRLKSGWGVVADDVVAGVYAAIVLVNIQQLWLG